MNDDRNISFLVLGVENKVTHHLCKDLVCVQYVDSLSNDVFIVTCSHSKEFDKTVKRDGRGWASLSHLCAE